MNTGIKLLAIGVSFVGLAAGAYTKIPALRTSVFQNGQAWLGWTEAARQADPVGFTNHVETQLKEDLDKLQVARGKLAGEVGALNHEIREQQALLEHAEGLAEEFRSVFHQASESGTFPVTVREAAYTEEQAVSQVSSLLAETIGYQKTLGKLMELRKQAESRLVDLTVRVDCTKSQLAMISTKRELLRARVLTDEAEELVAHVDDLLEGNSQVVNGNPIRSVDELIAASRSAESPRPSLEQARQFLGTKRSIEVVERGSQRESPTAGTDSLLVDEPGSKPIYQQN